MYLTVKQQLKRLSKNEYLILRELCHEAKNLKNQALYNVRQHYFNEGTYLRYEENYKLLKNSEHYKVLNSNMAEQIIKAVDSDFKSFFALLKLAEQGQYDYKNIHIPHYLPKDGFTTLKIAFVRISDNILLLPYSQIYKKSHQKILFRIPPILKDKTIKEIKIVPKSDARFFEIQYSYEVEDTQGNLNKNNALAIDLGINNFVTAVTNTGKSFIIDGRKIKSVNQGYNKKNAKLQSVKDKQKYGDKLTKRQSNTLRKRNNIINDYISKTARYIINYCLDNDIGYVVFGYNKDFQNDPELGKTTNQNFTFIPYGKLKKKLEYLCELNQIQFVEQEESYTSKASFWDKDAIPVYDKNNNNEHIFSGRRIHRGLYKTQKGILFNADVNGALNILRKSKVVPLTGLYCSGVVDTPLRIRIV